MLTAMWSFALVAGLVTLTPGLDTVLVLRTAARESRSAAFAAAVGINLGVLVWAVAAAAGISVLLTASRTAFDVVRGIGAAYMLWLGAAMIVNVVRGRSHPSMSSAATEQSGGTRWTWFRRGLLTNLLNPKIGAFYVALLPQFIPPGTNPVAAGLLLGLVHNVEGLAWFTLLILAVARISAWIMRPRVQRTIDAVAGTAILGFGLKLGLSRSA